MLPLPVQTVLLVLAGAGLFRLWRAATPSERWLQWVVNAGFLSRALLGQALFWISWAHLPFARGWQMGNGFWSFAPDAQAYFRESALAAMRGPAGIINANPAQPSLTFAQTLATALWLLGAAPVVGILLNLACYLGTIALILRWSANRDGARFAAAFAIVAISISPGFLLWSLQPLKEAFFAFLFVAFVCGCAFWQRAWLEPGRWKTRVGISILLFALMYALTGIRWYFGFFLLITATLFFVVSGFQASDRKPLAVTASIVVAFLLSRVFIASAGAILPTPIVETLTPRTAISGFASLCRIAVPALNNVRTGFNVTGGATLIHAGKRLDPPKPEQSAQLTQAQAPPAQDAEAAPIQAAETPEPSSPASTPAPSPTTTVAPPEVVSDSPVPVGAASTTPLPVVETAAPVAAEPAAPIAAEPAAPIAAEPAAPVATEPAAPIAAEPAAPVAADSNVHTTAEPEPQVAPEIAPPTATESAAAAPAVTAEPRSPAPQQASRVPRRVKRNPVAARPVEPHPIASPAIAPASEPEPPRPAVASPPPVETEEEGSIERPGTLVRRVLSGSAAIVLPRSMGESLGLFHIGGGRGMFWFTDLDTLVFDVILLIALALVFLRFRASWRNPLVWFVLVLTVMVTVPLVYSVTNFGTLFRLREITYIGLFLVPLALTAGPSRESERSEPDEP